MKRRSDIELKRNNARRHRVNSTTKATIFAREETVSSKGRVVKSRLDPMKGSASWAPLSTWTPPDDVNIGMDDDGDWYNVEIMREPFDPSVVQLQAYKPSRSKRSRRPHIVWKELYRQKYLEELMRADGRGDFRGQESCIDCVARKKPAGDVQVGEYRCKDCFLQDMLCADCCVRRHRLNPFHVVERWANNFFIPARLSDLGLVIRLNHSTGKCSNPRYSHEKLQILHTNGIHNVVLEFCDCELRVPDHIQCLRRGIYPASQDIVKTAATFRLLNHLHLLSLVGKGGTFDYYRLLERSTNNTGVGVPHSRYRALQRMLLQWRHLKMLKRAGRGNIVNGVETAGPGDLAIPCLSCPHPGINLPAGWEKARPEEKYLYAMIVCVDFNFRLKNQLVSAWIRDPGLSDGLAYFVPRKPYENYILKHVDEEEISSCVGFAALAQQNTRSSRGLRYTGIGAVTCARSEMILPLGAGNLEKGERYANSDFIVGSALSLVAHHLLIYISYDICCQWSVHLRRRMGGWDENLRIPSSVSLVPIIPKFHHAAHREGGHHKFDCKLVQGLGECDCEGCERVWAVNNGAATSTKSMGPGSRIDVLNDHFGWHNWQKYIGTGKLLKTRYTQAVKDRNAQVEAHRGLTASLPEGLKEAWNALCVAWEYGPVDRKGVVNPFETSQNFMSIAAVEKELAEYEEDRIKAGGASYHRTGPGAFLVLGLELEESQQKIQKLVKARGNPTTAQSTSITEQRTVLRNKIRNWIPLRHIYMPGLFQTLTELELGFGEENSQDVEAEDIPLWLPSAVPKARRAGVCLPGLPDMEDCLRSAQCQDSLDGIRHTLRVKLRMLLFKYANVTGQRDGVRSRTNIDSIQERAKVYAETYRRARRAKLALSGPGDWEQTYRVLSDADVCSYIDPERVKDGPGRLGTTEKEVGEEDLPLPAAPSANGDEIDLVTADVQDYEYRHAHGTGRTRMNLSWIWTTARVNNVDSTDPGDEILREVWAKSRARAERAKEEVLRLREEMQRTLMFLIWKAQWWHDRAEPTFSNDEAISEGIRAYALKQEKIQTDIAFHFKSLWSVPLADAEQAVFGSSGQDGADMEEDLDNDLIDDEGEEGEDQDEMEEGLNM